MNCLSLIREADQITEHEFDARDDLKKVPTRGAPKGDSRAVHVSDLNSHGLLSKRALPTTAFHQSKVRISNEELDGREDCEDSWKIVRHEHRRGFRLLPVEE